MRSIDLSLYLVLDPLLCNGNDGMVETARTAIEHGVTIVQLRAEAPFTKKEWYDAARALKAVLTPKCIPLIINDHPDIARAVDAEGVHLGQNDLSPDAVRRFIGSEKIVGVSVSNERELHAVPPKGVDYLGIGPVFPTTSKRNTAKPLGIAGLQYLSQQKRIPAVAIGGINTTNVRAVASTSVDGIAVISAICGQPDVAQATHQLHVLLQGYL